MTDLLTPGGLAVFAAAAFLQIALALDTLRALALEARRVAPDGRDRLFRHGVTVAVILRFALLFVLLTLIESYPRPIWRVDFALFSAAFSLAALTLCIGGFVLTRRAVKGVALLHGVERLGGDVEDRGQLSAPAASGRLALAGLGYAAASVFAALALTRSFEILALALAVGALAMLAIGDRGAEALAAMRRLAVFAYLLLLLLGAALLAEGAASAGLNLLGAYAVEPIAPATFFLALAALGAAEVTLGRFNRRLRAARRAEMRLQGRAATPSPRHGVDTA